MANPRELAEKAFTLLQDAIRDSESRASELDAELKRQRQPKNRLEERLDVLNHRLESVEAECQRWQREAGNLGEILENERAKIQQLKKKLEVAESGPDRLTKKEINFWRQRAEQFDAETREYKSRIASLKQELDAHTELSEDFAAGRLETRSVEGDLVSALEAAREESSSLRRQLALQESDLAELHDRIRGMEAQSSPSGEQKQLLDRNAALASELSTLAAELSRTREELTSIRQTGTQAEESAKRLADTVREREGRLAQLSAELEKTRTELTSKSSQEPSLRAELEHARRELEQARADLERVGAEHGARIQDLASELTQRQQNEQRREAELQELRDSLEAQGRELEQMRAGKQRLENELSELLSRNDVAADEHRVRLESLRDEITRKDAEISVSKAHQVRIENEMAALREQREEAREQLAGLEAELKEEKECTANLSELANGRREELTRLEERVEEADERYEEAKWRLGKAQYFERLVRRRKGLVNSLIAALRAKSKSNSALKAGLDGLRTFKATAEANQHKLLARIDKLNAELKEAESVVAKHQGATIVNEELQAAHGKISDLEERLNTQVEIIQTLENDLKAAKAIQHSRDNQATALEELRKELVTRNEIIARLEADADDQQRKLSKLRGSESETMRLKTVEEKDKSLIDTLQREIAQLREALARRDQDDSAGGGAQEDLSEKMKERDSSIARLMGTVKEQETQIGKLKESVDQWKKKYEFLSTEAPDAYQSVAEK